MKCLKRNLSPGKDTQQLKVAANEEVLRQREEVKLIKFEEFSRV